MYKRFTTLGIVLFGFGAAPAVAAPITQWSANRIADATVVAWISQSAAKIKALYAPDVVGFDPAIAPLSTDRATWDKDQDAFAAAKIDKTSQKQRKIQILGPDIFVLSGVWDIKSSSIPKNDITIRCTDVFQRNAAGKWPIVNEHCSVAPKA